MTMTLDEIVDDYIATHRASARLEMLAFRRLPTLKHAIRHASLCHWLPDLSKHPHQYLIPPRVLAVAERKLQRARHRLGGVANFEVLHSLVDREIGAIKGVGALMVYDIAHRIGAHLGRKPRLVYLHRGTRIGARRLGFTGATLDPRCLPEAFARLTPAEIEDCLCIYQDHFALARLHAKTPRACTDAQPHIRRTRKRCLLTGSLRI